MTIPTLVTATTHTPTLMCGCPACVAAYLASLAASGNNAAYDAAVKTIGAGSVLAVATPLAAPPAPTAAAVASGSPVVVQVPVVPAIPSTLGIPQPVGSFNPATLGTSVGTLSFSTTGGQYANSAYLGAYDAFSEIDYTTAATTPGTFYAAVTLNAGANYIFDLATYSYGYQSGSQNFGVSLELFNSSGVQQTTTASGTGYGGIAITPSSSGTYYVEVVATGNATNYWTLFDLRSAVSSPLPAATYTSIMPDGLSNATYVQAILAGGGSWWHVAGGGITPTATDGLSGALHSITYSFLTSDVAGDSYGGFAAMGANEQTAVKAALAYISSLFDITFTQVAAGTGMINYGSNDQGSVSAGYSNYANNPGGADVMISNDATYGYTNSSSYAIGTYAWETLLHETGHALGLKHPGNYNAGGGGTAAPYLPTDMDNREYSIMSYNNPSNITYTSDGTGGSFYFTTLNPTSYQLIDFYALQYLYGANTTTTSLVNQTFSWSLNQNIMETIYSIGSNSTIDLSNQTLPSVINLNDGTFSSIDERLNATDLAASLSPNVNSAGGYSFVNTYYASEAAQLYNGVNDLAIAPNAQIDILKLGGGADAVTANNDGDTIYLGSGTDTVTGGTSNDVFYLGSGSATINGGGGNNTVYASVTRASAAISYSNGTTTLTIGGATDTLTNIASIVFTDGTFTPGYTIPTITDPNATLSGLDTSVAASTLFQVIDHNGVASSALIYTLTDTGSAGHFYVNGVMQANGTPFTINATQLSQTTYVATIAGGTDTISMSVNDGIGATSAQFTVTSPGLTVAGVTLTQSLHAQTYAATTLFTSATDGAGSIASYTFDDTNTLTGAGYFRLNGVQQANNTPITVTAAQLSNLTYVSPQFGADTITVKITDGSGSSLSSTPATTTVTGPSAVAPTLTVQATTLSFGIGSSVLMSTLISATDNNGLASSALTYTLTDTGSTGLFSLNGATSVSSITVTAAQLAQTSYVSRLASGTDTITVAVTDGYGGSTSKSLTIATTAAPPPTITAGTTTLSGLDASVAASTLFSVSDPNGVSSSNFTYTLTDNGTAGSFVVNGVTEASGTAFTLTAAQFANLTYVAKTAGGTDSITVTVNDGDATGTATITVTSPGLTVAGETVTQAQHVQTYTNPVAALFTVTDGGGTPTYYSLEDLSTGAGAGYFTLNGVKQTNGTAFTVSAAQLSTLSYVGPYFGTDTLTLSATQSTISSAVATTTVTGPAAVAPSVTVQSKTLALGTGSSVLMSTLISATDNNGLASSALTYTLTDTGSTGLFSLNGAAGVSSITVTAAQLAQTTYVSKLASGTDTITVSVTDGYGGSTSKSLTITTTPVPSPTIIAGTTTLSGLDASVAASTLFSVSDPNGVSPSNFTYSLTDNGTAGSFVVNGVTEASGAAFTLTAAQFANLTYVAKTAGGTDSITVAVNDGFATGTATISVTSPGLTVAGKTLTQSQRNQTYSLSDLFTTTDGGGTITSYTIEDMSTGAGAGFFLLNGVEEANGTAFTVSLAQSYSVAYISPNFGTDTLTLSATQGPIASSVGTTTVQGPAAVAPSVTVQSKTLALGTGSSVQMYTLISATDNNGLASSALTYTLTDTGSTGLFSLNGTTGVSSITVTATQLLQTTYVSKLASGTDTITVSVTDGYGGSTSKSLTITTTPASPPVVQVSNITTATSGATYSSFASAISETDPNGVGVSGITYTLSYSGTGGVLYLNGNAEATGTNFTVSGTELSELSYSPSIYGGVDDFKISANDGYASSTVANFTVTSPSTPGAVFTPINANITAVRDEVFSTPASLWTESDTSGGTIVQYQLWDTDTQGTGHFTLNGMVETNDQAFTVTPGQLSQLSYQIVSGTQIIYIRANDGTLADPIWGAWSAGITVTAPAPLPAAAFTPVSATITATRDQVFSTPASLWTESDASGATIVQYQFWDTDTQGGVGNFMLNGVVETNDQAFTVTPGQLSQLSYQIVSGTQIIYVRANDGTVTDPNWGAWSAGITVTAPAPLPAAVFTPASATITATRDKVFSTPASLWTESDASGATIVQYQFWDTDTQGGVGNFMLNGVVETNDQAFTVTPGQLSQLSYQIVSGTQIIYVRANDGTVTDPNWGAWSAGITVTAPAPLPAAVFTPASATITATRDKVFSTPASLWTESDTSGATIVEYQFWDTDTQGGTGHFTLNGVVEANDQGFTVTSDQLSQLSYQIVSGTQIIYVRANDGTLTDPNWGAWSAGITVTAPAPLPAAVFTPASATITATRDKVFSTPASLWTESDASGATIVQYQFWDTDTQGGVGNFMLNGMVETNDQAFTVTPGQLSQLSYQIVSGTQIIYVRANDGTLTDPNWGAWSAGITVTAPAPLPAAVFTPASATITATRDKVFSTPASLWTESDASGATIVQYQFWDTDTQGGVGNFILNGVVETNDQAFTVTPGQLSQLSYQIVSGTQIIYVRANDGTLTDPNWGAWSAGITVTAPAPLPAAVFTPASATITATRDKVFSTPASLWTESDASGATIVQYQFWDTDTQGGVGNFMLNGMVETNDQAFTVTPGQLSQLSYQIVSGTQIIYVRANDGTLTDPNWGAWSAGITVTAPAPLPAAVFTPASATITATRDKVFSTPASLWTESDASGATIVQYQFWDTDTQGGVGNFILNGVVETNDQAFTVTPGQLSQLSYQIVSGTQIIYVRANDGTVTDPNWGAWSAGITVTAPAALPAAVFTPVSSTIAATRDEVFSTPALLWTESDASGSTTVQYQFWDTDTQGGLGNFTLNGVAETNDQAFTVTPGQLSQLSYQIVSGTQIIYVRANDGTLSDPNWGAWSAGITVTAPPATQVFPPVTANVTTVAGSVAAPVASAPVIHIPDLSSAVVSSPSVAVSSVVSPSALFTHSSQQLSPLFAVHHA